MDLKQTQDGLLKVRKHLEWIRHLTKTKNVVTIQVFRKHCPDCGGLSLLIWTAPSLLWKQHVLEEMPWDFETHSQHFLNLLDGQCINKVCGYSMWPFVTRMDPILLQLAPANAEHRHGEQLDCPYCKQQSVWGTARDGRTIAGSCTACERTIFYGQAAAEWNALMHALYRRESWLMEREEWLERKISEAIPSARPTLHGIGDPDDDNNT